MSWPPYSTALLRFKDKEILHVYTVPDGHRAVVKTISAQVELTFNGTLEIAAHGIKLVVSGFQAAYTRILFSGMWVLYERETLTGIMKTSAADVYVSGYVLREVPGMPAGGYEDESYDLRYPEQLPAPLRDQELDAA